MNMSERLVTNIKNGANIISTSYYSFKFYFLFQQCFSTFIYVCLMVHWIGAWSWPLTSVYFQG